MAAFLFVRDVAGGKVHEPVRAAARELRERNHGSRVSDADVARQLILAALRNPDIVRSLGMNGRGDRDE